MPKNDLDFIVEVFKIREEDIFIEDITQYDRHIDEIDGIKSN